MTDPPVPLTLIVATAPDQESGERIVRQLLDERLAACGNVVPGVISLFRWEGEVRREAEALLLLKTREELVDRLFDRVSDLHPYEVPELLSLAVTSGLPDYCAWVAAETAGVDA